MDCARNVDNLIKSNKYVGAIINRPHFFHCIGKIDYNASKKLPKIVGAHSVRPRGEATFVLKQLEFL